LKYKAEQEQQRFVTRDFDVVELEKYERWKSFEGISRPLYCESVTDDFDGFRVTLAVRELCERRLTIRVAGLIAYRNVNESYRLRTLARTILEDGPLYTVQSSRFVKWLVEESEGVLSASRVVHYAIFTAEDCIDIVADSEPSVSWHDV
jgi:hypothetical protein